ncbi:histidine phosphatase family protein [Angustibacter aerolatus]
MRLILVRHGQTPSNVQRLLDTAVPGADLTDLGRQQAERVPTGLADEPVEAVYASTLVRTQQTAGPLAAALGLDVQVRDGLREITAGDLELRADEASVRTYLDAVVAWADGRETVRVPGGESGTEFLDRYDAVVHEVAASGVRTAVLVSHGAAIRCWVGARCADVDAGFVAEHHVGNTGAVLLDGDPEGGWSLVRWQQDALGGAFDTPDELEGPASREA